MVAVHYSELLSPYRMGAAEAQRSPVASADNPRFDGYPVRLPAELLEVRRARTRARRDEPGLLAARSTHLPSHHRRIRNALQGVHDRGISQGRVTSSRG